MKFNNLFPCIFWFDLMCENKLLNFIHNIEMFKRSNCKEYYNRFKHIDMNINKFLQKKIVRLSCQVILPKRRQKKCFGQMHFLSPTQLSTSTTVWSVSVHTSYLTSVSWRYNVVSGHWRKFKTDGKSWSSQHFQKLSPLATRQAKNSNFQT